MRLGVVPDAVHAERVGRPGERQLRQHRGDQRRVETAEDDAGCRWRSRVGERRQDAAEVAVPLAAEAGVRRRQRRDDRRVAGRGGGDGERPHERVVNRALEAGRLARLRQQPGEVSLLRDGRPLAAGLDKDVLPPSLRRHELPVEFVGQVAFAGRQRVDVGSRVLRRLHARIDLDDGLLVVLLEPQDAILAPVSAGVRVRGRVQHIAADPRSPTPRADGFEVLDLGLGHPLRRHLVLQPRRDEVRQCVRLLKTLESGDDVVRGHFLLVLLAGVRHDRHVEHVLGDGHGVVDA